MASLLSPRLLSTILGVISARLLFGTAALVELRSIGRTRRRVVENTRGEEASGRRRAPAVLFGSSVVGGCNKRHRGRPAWCRGVVVAGGAAGGFGMLVGQPGGWWLRAASAAPCSVSGSPP